MAELFKDNPYPKMMFHVELPPTTALSDEDHTRLLRKGYVDHYVHREYPKHVPIGGTISVPNNDGSYADDPRTGLKASGTFTVLPRTKLVHSKAEHDALLESLKAQGEGEIGVPGEEIAKRRGRPPAKIAEQVPA